jgi:heavy metal translocating P-type ATPase
MAVEYQVKHTMPGRIRIHLPAFSRNEALTRACGQFLATQEGVADVRVNPLCASLVIEFDPRRNGFPAKLRDAMSVATPKMLLSLARTLQSDPRTIHAKDKVESNGQAPVPGGIKLNPLALPTASLALSLFGGSIGTSLALPLLSYNAFPILKRAFKVVREEHRLNVDFLDSLAITISTLQGNLFTSAFMTWLINLGDFIRDLTAARSKRAIEDLLDYQAQLAWVVRGRRKFEIPVARIVVGDTVVVYTGEMIPVDGEVIKGRASVEQKTITGESLPVDRQVGSKVYAATVVREGKLYLRAERVGRETTAAQIVRMVADAPLGETRIQNYAEKFADRLVAPSLAAATGLYAISGDINRFLSMVIIDYGTGIRVAAPTSVLASMIHAARHGIMIKGGSQLEKLSRVDTILFDKTGTLTEGRPQVQSIRSYNGRHFSPEKILALAAAAEARLTHPVAEAVLAKAREMNVKIPERSESRYHIGLGVEVHVNGHTVHLGSERFLRDQNIKLDSAIGDLRQINSYGHSALLLAVEGEITGAISYADQIRTECSAVIKTLHNRGLRNLIMLTGDNSTVAAGVASRLGLDRFVANVFPAEKAEIVAQLQREGRVVAMVGDGINDSPALARADVGVAMKGGADIAREAADVVLMEENLWKLIAALDVSSDAMKLIRQNFAIIAGLNTLAYALAIPRGLINPGITTLISNGSAILATLNAVRPVMRD